MYFHTVFSLGDWITVAFFAAVLLAVVYYYLKWKIRHTREAALKKWNSLKVWR